MAGRKAPSWFVKALKGLNPHFSVEWDRAREVWAVKEAVRHSSLVADVEGAPVYRIHRRPETALRFTTLGSRLLDFVRRNDPRRYSSVEQMVKKLRIDEGERPSIPTSTFVPA
jgi:hypothetical protein